MSLSKFESMLKTNNVYFFDSVEFEEIIQHYLDNGKHSLANKAVKLGLEQHPTSIVLKLLKVELLIFEDKLQNATSLINEIEAIAPNNEELLIQKAIILSKNDKHVEAIQTLNQILAVTDDPADIWSMVGMEYLYLDDFENARLNFANCIDVDYEDYSSLYNVVYCFDMENNHEEAIVYLTNYIDTNPYCEVAWHQLGRQYFVLNRFKEALRAFDYAVLIDESFIGGYLEKAKTLEELERYEEAIQNYLITLELDDPTAFVFVRIGECYQKLNDLDAATKYFKKAVHEDPLLDKAWLLLTNLFQEEEQYQKALYYIRKALHIDDSNPMYWKKYAEISLKLNFYEEAVKAFEKCLDLEDESLEIYVGLADVLLFLGEFKDALKVIIKAKNTYKQFAEIEYRLCGLFMLTSKEKYALIHLKNGLAIDADYRKVIEELYPTVFDNENVQTIISNYLKATE
ncbi:tetratricopeptide repeat protein [Polaribacter gochangensis]|uniref:tetratricopeptide repeat protein n=1 Tax=Polaribacter gochangensis TaxID=3252903 RepID=UPI003904DE9D